MSGQQRHPGPVAVLLMMMMLLVSTLPSCRGQSPWTARTPPSSADPFEALRTGEVFTLSEMSERVGQQAPPAPAPAPPPPPPVGRHSFDNLQERLPLQTLMSRWSCCRLSDDLITWRHQCRSEEAAPPSAAPGSTPWLSLKPGCACCNSTDTMAGEQLECICHGANITTVPQTLPAAVSLITLTMTNIVEVNRDDFLQYSTHLQDIVFSKNEQLRRIRADAFRNLPRLLSLYIQYAPNLRYVSRQAWTNLTSLKSLRIVGTGLEEAPDLSGLQTEDNIMHLIDLDGNRIRQLPANSVRVTTDQLSLANNQLEAISAQAFNGSLIGTIQLNGNLQLSHVDQFAFKGLGGLRKLDLSDTALTSLPTHGLEDIEQLLLKRTASLRTFPSVYHFRSIQKAELTYPYHCCAFNFPDIQDPEEHRRYQEWSERLRNQTNCTRQSDRLTGRSGGGSPPASGGIFHTAVSVESSQLVCDYDEGARLKNVDCRPVPDAFNPCEDIMGYRTLRVAVWLVVVTAVVGNVVVLVVLINRSFKLTTPKFLMCNLAFADLCMGLYLLIIASMDVHTIGVYFSYAIDWQEGLGCQVAGFLTVFASELSVFTLVTITCERWYAITNAIYLTKRLRITGAVRVMAAGWLYSAVMAAFPLVGIGSYSKTSICLPVVRDEEDQAGIAFLLFLLLGNCLAFLLISWFYLRMYCSISTVERGLVRPNDLKVAKRMALLVFTDFACWAPITFFGVTAIIGFPLINVTNSKILLVFFYPINSCANPYLYAIFTKQFRQEFFLMLGRRGLCRRQALRFRAAGTLSRNDLLKLSNGSRSTQPRSGQTLLEMSSMRSRKLSAESAGVPMEGRPVPGAPPERRPSGRRDCRLSPVLEASRTAEASVATPPHLGPPPTAPT